MIIFIDPDVKFMAILFEHLIILFTIKNLIELYRYDKQQIPDPYTELNINLERPFILKNIFTK